MPLSSLVANMTALKLVPLLLTNITTQLKDYYPGISSLQQTTPAYSYTNLVNFVQQWHLRNPGSCGLPAAANGNLQQAMQMYEQSCDFFRTLPAAVRKNPLTRIINGCTVKNIQLAPFAVGLNVCGFLCSGTLISDQHVLTAAHCFSKANCISTLNDNCPDYAYVNTSPIYIDQSKRGIAAPGAYQVMQVALHPLWNSDMDEYDLAIVQLDRPVPNAMPACLPDRRMVFNDNCVVYGYGVNSYDGEGGDSGNQIVPTYPLRVAKVQMSSTEECWATYGVNDEGILYCARGRASQGTDLLVQNGGYADACLGDSGAGVVCPGTDPRTGAQKWVVRGVAAAGVTRCGEDSGVYTHAINAFSNIPPNVPALCSQTTCRAQGRTCQMSMQCCQQANQQMVCDQQTACSNNGYCQLGKICIKPTVLG